MVTPIDTGDSIDGAVTAHLMDEIIDEVQSWFKPEPVVPVDLPYTLPNN